MASSMTHLAVGLFESESTYGVDPTPSPSTNAVLLGNLSVKVNGKPVKRDFYRATFSPLASVIGAKTVELGFETELKGGGVAYAANALPEIAPLLRGSGMGQTLVTTPGSETVTYKPTSSGADGAASFTGYVYLDGALVKLVGCYATFSLPVKAGEYAKIKWTVKGKFVSWTDASMPSATYLSVNPPIAESLGLTLGGWNAGIYEAIEISLDNNIVERLSVNASNGLLGFAITGRDPKGSINPLMVTEATKSFWANWSASTLEALSATIGSVQYNRIVISAPKVQLVEIGIGDRNGERAYQIPVSFTGDAGDDELVLTFS